MGKIERTGRMYACGNTKDIILSELLISGIPIKGDLIMPGDARKKENANTHRDTNSKTGAGRRRMELINIGSF